MLDGALSPFMPSELASDYESQYPDPLDQQRTPTAYPQLSRGQTALNNEVLVAADFSSNMDSYPFVDDNESAWRYPHGEDPFDAFTIFS